MELLLWLWYFDNLFFFNLNPSIQFFKNSWILPLITHIFLIVINIFYIIIGTKSYLLCNTSYYLWQAAFLFMHLLFIFLEFYFRLLIDKESEKISKITKEKINDKIIKTTLSNPCGLMIFFMSIINFIGSILLVSFYSYGDNEECNQKLYALLFWYSIFIIICGLPSIICLIIILIKYNGINYIKRRANEFIDINYLTEKKDE